MQYFVIDFGVTACPPPPPPPINQFSSWFSLVHTATACSSQMTCGRNAQCYCNRPSDYAGNHHHHPLQHTHQLTAGRMSPVLAKARHSVTWLRTKLWGSSFNRWSISTHMSWLPYTGVTHTVHHHVEHVVHHHVQHTVHHVWHAVPHHGFPLCDPALYNSPKMKWSSCCGGGGGGGGGCISPTTRQHTIVEMLGFFFVAFGRLPCFQ